MKGDTMNWTLHSQEQTTEYKSVSEDLEALKKTTDAQAFIVCGGEKITKQALYSELTDIYTQLYRLSVHILDFGKVEGGTVQSKTLIDNLKQFRQLCGIDWDQVKSKITPF